MMSGDSILILTEIDRLNRELFNLLIEKRRLDHPSLDGGGFSSIHNERYDINDKISCVESDLEKLNPIKKYKTEEKEYDFKTTALEKQNAELLEQISLFNVGTNRKILEQRKEINRLIEKVKDLEERNRMICPTKQELEIQKISASLIISRKENDKLKAILYDFQNKISELD